MLGWCTVISSGGPRAARQCTHESQASEPSEIHWCHRLEGGSDANACAWRGDSDKGGKTGYRTLKAFCPVESEANVCAVVMLCQPPPKVRSPVAPLTVAFGSLGMGAEGTRWVGSQDVSFPRQNCKFRRVVWNGWLFGLGPKKGPKNACQAGMCG